MKKIEKAVEPEPKKPDKTTLPKKNERAPEKEEKERARYYSPPCMMGELDEIIHE